MAKDMLDAIRAAEEECRLREEQAKSDADELIEQAKRDAEALIAKSDADALAENERALADAKLKCAEEERRTVQSSAEECERLRRLAEKNRPGVIRKAAEALLS